MNAEEFVALFKKDKDYMLNEYLNSGGTLVNSLINELKLDEKQKKTFSLLLNTVLTDVFYSILLGLDGAANIGGVQQPYKIYDDNNNLIAEYGDLEAAAYEAFHENEAEME